MLRQSTAMVGTPGSSGWTSSKRGVGGWGACTTLTKWSLGGRLRRASVPPHPLATLKILGSTDAGGSGVSVRAVLAR